MFNYSELHSRPVRDIERLAAHEGGHVLLSLRGEEDLEGLKEPDDSESTWHLKCICALATVEYRIEKMLAELGYAPAESVSPSHMDDYLFMANAQVIEALLDEESSDPAHLRRLIMVVHDHLTKILAYLAAAVLTQKVPFDPSRLPLTGRENWSDLVEPTWDDRLRFWSAVPSAGVALSQESWRNLIRKGVELESGQLQSLGFSYSPSRDGGSLFVRVASDAVCDIRMRRALQQHESRS